MKYQYPDKSVGETVNVGQRIREIRESIKMSGNQLAKLSGIGQSTVSAIENGTNQPTVETLQRICDALGVSLSDFFSEDRQVQDDRVARLRPEQRQALEKFLETL